MRGIIGIPTTGTMPVEFVESIYKLEIPGEVDLQFMRKAVVYAAREEMAAKLLTDRADWLLMIDDDMVFPPDTIVRLLSHNVPVVSALCYKRIPPYNPCAWHFKDIPGSKPRQIKLKYIDPDAYPEGQLIPVDAVGAACLLIRRPVIEQLPGPWFYPMTNMGEDISFCVRLKDAGIPIYADPGINIGHLETRAVGYYEYSSYRRQMEGTL